MVHKIQYIVEVNFRVSFHLFKNVASRKFEIKSVAYIIFL